MDALDNAVIQAVKLGDIRSTINTLRDHPEVVHLKDARGVTLLHWAVDRENKEIIGVLLSYGADINAPLLTGITALHWAVYYGSVDIVDFLLKNGADPNRKTNKGQTPLHWAILRDPLLLEEREDRPQIVSLLMSNDADINAKTDEGITPCVMASTSPYYCSELISLLQRE